MNKKKADSPPRQDQPTVTASLAKRLTMFAWLVLVMVGFWAPYFRVPFSMLSVLTGIYGIFVIIAAVSATLGLLRWREQGEAK